MDQDNCMWTDAYTSMQVAEAMSVSQEADSAWLSGSIGFTYFTDSWGGI